MENHYALITGASSGIGKTFAIKLAEQKINLILTARREKKLNKLLKTVKDPVLISHIPPYGYVDKLYNGKHVGSKAVLAAIKKYKPKLVLSGHIHEAKGKAKIGKSVVYNLGYRGDYKIMKV